MKQTTLTVALPAYNEEANIANILDQLLKQQQTNFTLKKILIYSDGCTDSTVQIVKEKMKASPSIALVEGKTQKGKLARLNQIFQENTSDVLITLDADLGLVGSDFLDKFVLALATDTNAKMVAAHGIPVRPKNFMGKLVVSTFIMWDYVRLSIPRQDHVQNLYGAANAYRGSFAKTLHIPEEVTDERLYLYLMAKKTDGFRYTFDAVFKYGTMTTLSEYIKLSERSFGKPQPYLDTMFGVNTEQLCKVPRKYMIQGILKALYHEPVYTPTAILLGFILSKRTHHKSEQNSALWEIAKSSKRIITT